MTRIKLGLAILLAAAGFAHAAERVTVSLATGEWPPYLSESLKHRGFAARIVSEAFAVEGVQAQIRFYPWPRATRLAQYADVDGAFVYSRTPERERLFLYSAPVVSGDNVFFHLKSRKFDWRTLNDLKGLRIGGNAGYNYGTAFEQAERGQQLNVERSIAEINNFNKLLAGRLDVVLTSKDVGNFILQTQLQDRQHLVTHHPLVLITLQNHFIVARSHPRAKWLIATFNRGLAQLQKQGKLQQYAEESLRGLYLPGK